MIRMGNSNWVALQEVDGLGDLAGNGRGEAAGDEIQMDAVEEGEGDGLEEDQGDEDDEQAAAEQAAGNDPLQRADHLPGLRT